MADTLYSWNKQRNGTKLQYVILLYSEYKYSEGEGGSSTCKHFHVACEHGKY